MSIRNWIRAQVCRLRGHRLESGYHLAATLYCARCKRVQFYYHHMAGMSGMGRKSGLIVPADATLDYLGKLGLKG